MTKTHQSINLGVSSCLLGEKVRFDGEGKRHRWLTEELGKVANFISICPEMAMGLGAPREAMRIVKNSNSKEYSLESSKSKKDMTGIAQKAIRDIAAIQDLRDLDGYVLMANSPMCGLSHVKVYDSKNNIPHKSGMGFFSSYLKKELPFLPTTEHGRLNDMDQRDAFLTHVYLYRELRILPRKLSLLQAFHRNNKFLLLSYHPEKFRLLGPLVANAKPKNMEDVINSYIAILSKLFAKPRKRSQGTDALLHMVGFFKKELTGQQKKQILDAIQSYNEGLVSISVPLNLLKFVNSHTSSAYIQQQTIFAPYPNFLHPTG